MYLHRFEMCLHWVKQSIQLAIGSAAHMPGMFCRRVPHVDELAIREEGVNEFAACG
jgi:hypothetical protein